MKSFKNWMKKGIALGAAFAMTVTVLPVSDIVNAAGPEDASARAEDGLRLWYDFESLKSGTVITDLSGNGYGGVIRACARQNRWTAARGSRSSPAAVPSTFS